MVGLLIVAALVAQAFGQPTDVHPVSGGAPIHDRKTLEVAFDDWLSAQDSCAVPYGSDADITIRPMLMFAAEGGGIRAAYWTAAALDLIAKADTGCARRSALFSTGASGGAVGLTLARFSDDPLATVKAITGPDALSEAAISMLSSDILTSAAGIRFASDTDSRGVGSHQLLDRAGLMEVAWEEEAGPHLQQPFLTDEIPTSQTGAITGHLILTTSVAGNGCRALLSQVDLGGDTTLPDRPTTYRGDFPACGDSPGVAGPNSFDLFDAYGLRADDVGDGAEHCLGNIPAITGALLASRFPYVTPSGVVGPCQGNQPERKLHPLQIIDGGYTDNTGLGTISDMKPVWGPLVRDHNDAVLDAGVGDLVVPVVVYLENGTGGDYTVVGEDALDRDAVKEQEDAVSEKGGEWALPWWPERWSVPEAVVPLVGARAGKNHKLETQAWLQKAWEAVYCRERSLSL